MPHSDGLITTIAAGLGIAFIGGFVATRLRLPAIVGYLVAGIILGPFTPGFVANEGIAQELAEVGVILLMFGVGVHFSLRDLLTVRGIAVPGAIGQMAITTTIGTVVAMLWGWSLGSGIVLGLSVAVASTVVLLRALAERDALQSVAGHVAVGWLIVQDLFTVIVLVLLPSLAPVLSGGGSGDTGQILLGLVVALGKVVALGALMLIVGARAIPWLLVQVTRTGSRELFTLAVLAVALGLAVLSALVFGASLALGAFLAGVVVSESDLSHQAAADALPMRDAFAVLFFVSVGMLFDPAFLLVEPLKVLAILATVILGNGLAALAIVMALGHPLRTGLTVAVGLAQIGEFSFILAEQGRQVGLLPVEGHSLILAVAILSITLNPLAFAAVDPMERWLRRRPALMGLLERRGSVPAVLPDDDRQPRGHAVLIGHGRVGRLIAHSLAARGFAYVVIDQNHREVEELRKRGVMALFGDASNPLLLDHAHLDRARVLVVAIDDAPSTRFIVAHARQENPRLTIVARTHGEAEWAFLRQQGVDEVVLSERELAAEMVRFTLQRFGVGGAELQALVQGVRNRDQES